ncbi:MAG: hypothetical protein GMKNLPBB_02843 [Myxococcota bacterium]|nr:hypothetical protein [Myxococcota bacterium]
MGRDMIPLPVILTLCGAVLCAPFVSEPAWRLLALCAGAAGLLSLSPRLLTTPPGCLREIMLAGCAGLAWAGGASALLVLDAGEFSFWTAAGGAFLLPAAWALTLLSPSGRNQAQPVIWAWVLCGLSAMALAAAQILAFGGESLESLRLTRQAYFQLAGFALAFHVIWRGESPGPLMLGMIPVLALGGAAILLYRNAGLDAARARGRGDSAAFEIHAREAVQRNRLLRSRRFNGSIERWLGDRALQSRDPDGARDWYLRASRQGPPALAWISLAQLEWDQGRFEQGDLYLSRVALDPLYDGPAIHHQAEIRSSGVRVRLGLRFWLMGRAADAREWWIDEPEAGPNGMQANLFLARQYRLEDKLAFARERWNQVLAGGRIPREWMCEWIAWLRASGQIAAALDAARQLHGENPGCVEGLKLMAEHGEAGERREAEAALRLLEPTVPKEAVFSSGMALLGYGLEKEVLRPGDSMMGHLVWEARAPVRDAVAFVHIRTASPGQWQEDHPPGGGTYPPSRWCVGERFRDEWRWTVPRDIPPGTYSVVVGLYEPRSGIRMLRMNRTGEEKDHIALRQVTIQ